MINSSHLKPLVFILCTFLLFACSDDKVLPPEPGTTTGPTPGTTGLLRIGSGSNANFTEGGLEIKNTTVVANGSTDVSAYIVDSNDNLSKGTNIINFESYCSIQGLASFTSASVTTTTGIATTTYIDQGCQVSDTIIATADWDTNLTASGDITIDSQGPVIANTLRIGTGSLLTFVEGAVAITTPNIASDGSTLISVNLVDANGDLLTSANTVTFTSDCEQLGAANFNSSIVNTSTGTASTTYNAAGCVGPDVISATVTVGTTNKVATGTVTVAAANAGSVQYTSASATTIALKGTGTPTVPETSTISFTVLDGNNQPVSGEAVTFALNSTIGGITLSTYTGTSNASGIVTTTVQSGTVATSVRVSAIVDSNTLLVTSSNSIVIATGPPDQDSMSLSAETLNPRAWNLDGKIVKITARLADRFNNQIQDGTTILFTTELGSIQSSCQTVGGGCSVNWTSQDPRGDAANAGRSTILATVVGEESFVDENANGVFDNGDSFTDLGEAFVDANENGIRDAGEPFTDFNGNNTWDAPSGKYNGPGCTHTTLCDPTPSISVRDSLVLVMAEDNPAILAMGTNGLTNDLCADYLSCQIFLSSNPTLNTSAVFNVNVTLGGIENEQALPQGTSVSFSATNGKLTSGDKHTVPNTTSAAYVFSVSIAADTTPSSDGSLKADIVIGDGGGTYSFFIANISDDATIPVTTLQLGKSFGSGFTAGELEIKVPDVETGGSTEVSVYIVDGSNNLSKVSNNVTFESACSLQGLAFFTPANVNTLTGIATTTYTDNGCAVSDTLSASADWEPTLTASGSITIKPSAVVLRIGTGTGIGFTEGAVDVVTPSILADGSTAVTVNLVNALGALVTSVNTVTFSSVCEQAGSANFTSSSVTNSTGTFSTTYNAAGCSGTDTITATVTVDTVDKTASGTVDIAPTPADSIVFTSVSNTSLALKGAGSTTGLPESSLVTFTVNANGVPVSNEAVTFTLTSTLGGITLAQYTAISDGSGQVSTTLKSGSIPTSVSVNVVVDSTPSLTATSDAIAISTGPAHQDSMSLSATTLNPRAWDVDGTTVEITARLADRYSNPVKDGTPVNFKTELGSIGSTCTTVDGACSVNWTSQSPKNDLGRATIMAHAQGDESFVDSNGNGVFDNGIDTFTDLEEAYLDINENGVYDAGETFVDLDENGSWTAGNGVYNGSSCPTCAVKNTVTVRDSLVLVMAEDVPAVHAIGINGSTNDLCNSKAGCDAYLATFPELGTNIASSMLVTLGGTNNAQTLPAGTDVTFTTTNGEIISGASAAIGNTTSPNVLYLKIDADTTPSNDGFLSAEIKMGDGGQTFNIRLVNIDDTGTAVAPTTILLGTGTGIPGTFVNGALDILTPALSAGGSTPVTVNIVNSSDGNLNTDVNTVTFTSTCVLNNQASFDTPSVITDQGTVTVNYKSSTCSGLDVITATSGTATATGNVNVAPAAAGSIQFTSASSSLIALHGTGSTSGLPESSDITFTVTDSAGFAIANETINFSLDSNVGGIALSFATADTDSNGEVVATVISGTVATSVRVTATVAATPALVTTSSAIVIATGPPDQDSFSLSASQFNPRGWNLDGTEVTITARLADRFNNRIQDGTAISFKTELGSIQPSCTTTNGACSVTWTSQNPRGTVGPAPTFNAGRSTILATVEGEESFIDNDGDGIFSDADTLFDDLGEAYQDENENGAYDLGEPFIDFNTNGLRDAASGTFNGSGCTRTIAPFCDANSSVTVRSSLVLVMSEDTPSLRAIGINGFDTDGVDAASCDAAPNCICVDGCTGGDSGAGIGVGTTYPTVFNVAGTVSSITYTIAGASNQQVLPVGSSINFSAGNGTITAGGSHTVTNTSANSDPTLAVPTGITHYTVYIAADDTPSADGVLNTDISVGGITYNLAPILITD